MRDAQKTKQSAEQKGQGKNKNERPSNQKHVSTSLKKSKDGGSAGPAGTVSNGSVGLNTLSKQPLKSRSFNSKQVRLFKVKVDNTFSFVLLLYGICLI